jgi:hypothetical protein
MLVVHLTIVVAIFFPKMAVVTKNLTLCKHVLVTYQKNQNNKCCCGVMSFDNF